MAGMNGGGMPRGRAGTVGEGSSRIANSKGVRRARCAAAPGYGGVGQGRGQSSSSDGLRRLRQVVQLQPRFLDAEEQVLTAR